MSTSNLANFGQNLVDYISASKTMSESSKNALYNCSHMPGVEVCKKVTLESDQWVHKVEPSFEKALTLVCKGGELFLQYKNDLDKLFEVASNHNNNFEIYKAKIQVLFEEARKLCTSILDGFEQYQNELNVWYKEWEDLERDGFTVNYDFDKVRACWSLYTKETGDALDDINKAIGSDILVLKRAFANAGWGMWEQVLKNLK
jgi:hypothetical protein